MWSACVAPAVDLRECTLHLPPQKKRQQGRTHSGFETHRRRHQKSKTGGVQKGHVSSENFLKKSNLE